MKSKSSYLFGAIALGLVTMIVWAASLAAQQAASPNTIRITQPTPPDASRFEIQSIVVPQNQKPTHSYYGPAVPGLPLPAPGVYQTSTAPLDAKTAELVNAYLSKQSEISQLVKKYGDATEELDKNSLRDEIAKATADQFDLRQQVRAREIEQLKKRLADVETTVQKRNELKDKIVEKRVADILREPDQLSWEPLALSPGSMFAPRSGVVQPNPYAPGQLGPIPVPTVTYGPRTVLKHEEEVVVDAEGKQKVIRRPVSETVYEAVERAERNKSPGGIQSPLDDRSPDSTLPSTATLPTVGGYQPIRPSTMTVAEAAARVRFVEAKRDQLLGQKEKDINRSELKSLEAELDLAKLIHARTQVEYEGRTKLLELDVRHAESIYEQALAAFTETQEINNRAPNSFPSTQVARLKAAAEQAHIELERAKTILEIHQKANAPQAETSLLPQ